MDVIVLSIPIHTHGTRTWMINLISWKWTMCGFGFLFVFQGCKLHNRVWSSSSLISIWKDAHDAPFFQTTFCPSLVQHEWLDFEHYEVTIVLLKRGVSFANVFIFKKKTGTRLNISQRLRRFNQVQEFISIVQIIPKRPETKEHVSTWTLIFQTMLDQDPAFNNMFFFFLGGG